MKAVISELRPIGEGTKAGDDDKIGRFGIGFKAVFAYTETPRIWSPTYSFEISELVLPRRIPERVNINGQTHFEFPFNNPKKSPSDASTEISKGLDQLIETTLLFLKHIESISWSDLDGIKGELLRIQHSKYHIEILKQQDGKLASSAHFLRFTAPVEGLEKQRAAVAYELELLPKVKKFKDTKKIAGQLRVVPARVGRVAVFFPAEKEASCLRFHLHAPFVPELSRASIKDTPANEPLFMQLARLAASSLHNVRRMGLLNTDFLEVLPNSNDGIPSRYQCIRKSILDALNNEKLTPTHGKSYAPAKYLVQGRASLKSLLSTEDLEFLVEYEKVAPQWAITATQRNSNADRLLNDLDMNLLDMEILIQYLEEGLSAEGRYIANSGKYEIGPIPKYVDWISQKSLEWHQKLYATLHKDPDFEDYAGTLGNLWIVRLSNGKYSIGDKCFFPARELGGDGEMPRVDLAVYSSGKSKQEQDSAKNFLLSIGVREAGKAEEVEVILKTRYCKGRLNPHLEDIIHFVELVEEQPDKAGMFAEFFIFHLDYSFAVMPLVDVPGY